MDDRINFFSIDYDINKNSVVKVHLRVENRLIDFVKKQYGLNLITILENDNEKFKDRIEELEVKMQEIGVDFMTLVKDSIEAKLEEIE